MLGRKSALENYFIWQKMDIDFIWINWVDSYMGNTGQTQHLHQKLAEGYFNCFSMSTLAISRLQVLLTVYVCFRNWSNQDIFSKQLINKNNEIKFCMNLCIWMYQCLILQNSLLINQEYKTFLYFFPYRGRKRKGKMR